MAPYFSAGSLWTHAPGVLESRVFDATGCISARTSRGMEQTVAELTPGGFRAIMSILIIRETVEIMLMMTTLMTMMTKMRTMATIVSICRCHYK